MVKGRHLCTWPLKVPSNLVEVLEVHPVPPPNSCLGFNFDVSLVDHPSETSWNLQLAEDTCDEVVG